MSHFVYYVIVTYARFDPASSLADLFRVLKGIFEVCGVRNVEIGIICGSGLQELDFLKDKYEKDVTTPFGKPSQTLTCGTVEDVQCVILSRHGAKHTIMPTLVNYRANIHALKEEGCTHILATTACGSLQESISPGDIVVLDQFIDRTTKRCPTFFDGSDIAPKGICHLEMHTPFSPKLAKLLHDTSTKLGYKTHPTGTVVTIEGPRFSTRAESKMFRTWGGHIINMTTVPEVILAKELAMCYSSIALVTDYDSWRENEDGVSVDTVLKTFKENAVKAENILKSVIPEIAKHNWTDELQHNKEILTGSILSYT
ncbi:S-methyl-5'-thioadenosine phosphorylase [Octopus bimaculoides]|uniref:S-methyl-5'-thioadenosine phosphorylase n=1 Tax=Octopus bimaculoides TaxID=37653 RepID=UPI0022E1653B|nr:S-methyl-5'-thioadenosine phosphorylase [Octopus bimaculoides]